MSSVIDSKAPQSACAKRLAIPALRQDQIIYGTSETFTMPGSAWNIDGLPKVVGGSWPF